MNNKTMDVTGIGNAIVDVIARTDDAFLTDNAIEKGAMNLVDAERSNAIYERMGPGIEMSGGSAANTIVGLASLGGQGAFIGKVKEDSFGKVFRHDIIAAGVRFETGLSTSGPPTASCLVLVTGDAQRSMNTHLGACVDLGPEDVDEDLIRASKTIYLEGYLWDPPRAKEAFLKAAAIAHGSGGQVALSLSDPFCVGRHRDEFLQLVERHVDILFANEDEITSLYQVSDFDSALQAVRGHCDTVALTRGAKGSVVLSGGEVHVLDAEPVGKVVDTTGAGDLYAAGFLYGYTQQMDPARCGRLGGIAAAEIIGHYGARPEADLKALATAALGGG
ncbi:MAG: adenosine kinase [Proteobacteria bacterium]|nr:adenosine kinase [Pseudomonadota bacterium]MDA1308100.1 adenosine kinase [Pseudomonadota bacterium]